MASHYWLGTTSTNPAIAANWSLASGGAPSATAPGSGDAAIFDGGVESNGNNACTLAGNTAWGSLTLTELYTATLDLADSAYTLTITDGGSVTLDGGGIFDCGMAIISITNGTYDFRDQTTYTRGSSTLVLNGTSTFFAQDNKHGHNLTIAAGAEVTQAGGSAGFYGTITINGQLTVTGVYLYVNSACKVVANEDAVLTGTGTIYFLEPAASCGWTTLHSGATISIANVLISNPVTTAIFAAGTYGCTLFRVRCNSTKTLTLSGNYIFTGSIELETFGTTPSLTIANDTNDPNIEIRGNVIWDDQTGTITWTKGAGTITASGTAAQSWDWNDATIEDIVINKTGGTLTFTDGFTADSVNHQNGTIDPNGQTLATTGDWNMNSTAVMLDPESSTFTIGGNAIWAGVVHSFLSLSGSASWLFNCAGQAILKYANIKYCNASGSTNPVRAIECGDSGNNTNVVFQGLRSFVRSFRRGIKKS